MSTAQLSSEQETIPNDDRLATCERQIEDLAERLRKLVEVFSPESLSRRPTPSGIVIDQLTRP
jgi:hypothetical protein